MKIRLFSEIFPIFIAYHQRRNERGKGAQLPGRRVTAEGQNSQ